jgi:hypothetical protein
MSSLKNPRLQSGSIKAIELEKKIIAIVEQDSEKPRLKEGNDSR